MNTVQMDFTVKKFNFCSGEVQLLMLQEQLDRGVHNNKKAEALISSFPLTLAWLSAVFFQAYLVVVKQYLVGEGEERALSSLNPELKSSFKM